jgi:uncharacterized membrane protein YcjF (UPF0283 family)
MKEEIIMAYNMHGFAAKHRPKRSVWKIVFGGIAVLFVGGLKPAW